MSKETRKPFLSAGLVLLPPSGHDHAGRSSPNRARRSQEFMMRGTVSSRLPQNPRRPHAQPEAKSAELRREAADAPAAGGRKLDARTAVVRTVVQDRPPSIATMAAAGMLPASPVPLWLPGERARSGAGQAESRAVASRVLSAQLRTAAVRARRLVGLAPRARRAICWLRNG